MQYLHESVFSLSDLNLADPNSFPSLEIDAVTMMGDFNARNAPNFNSFTKFEMKLDLLNIEQEAFERASKFFDDFDNDEDYTVSFDEFECYEESETSKKDREQAEKDEIIQEFMNGYNTFNQQFWLDYN